MRLFTGLELPDTIKSQLLARQSGIAGGRWQNHNQLHLTLNFIGEIPLDEVAPIQALVSGLEIEPAELKLKGVGHFGNRAVWVGIAPEEPLREVQQDLANALQAMGLTLDKRRYHPHITIARLRGHSDYREFLQAQAEFESDPFEFRQVSLFASTPARGGSHYEVIARNDDQKG